jgi:hypothetical protein
MRNTITALTLLTLSAPVLAADALPTGWTQREDGAYVHTASAAICPAELGGLKRAGLEAKAAPDLGICTYTSEQDREGLIRVRQYVRGQGETSLAIQNDIMLIEPPPGSPNVVAGQRVGPGPEKNGAPTQQFVITVAHNGILIDCVSRRLKSDQGDIATDFALACMKVQGKER